LRAVGATFGAATGAWFIIFIPTFLAGMASFESDPVWWSWPSVGAAVVLCGAYAWRVRRRRPFLASGTWIGIALGLLHAGLCFSGL
jgi:hypothetical protein